MTEEHKALIGKRCTVEFEGEPRTGTLVGLLESIKITKEIILYQVKLDGKTKFPWYGFNTVEFQEDV